MHSGSPVTAAAAGTRNANNHAPADHNGVAAQHAYAHVEFGRGTARANASGEALRVENVYIAGEAGCDIMPVTRVAGTDRTFIQVSQL